MTRFLLTNERFFNLNEAFIEDSAGYATGLYNDEPLVDDSNAEEILILNPDVDPAGTSFRRFRSTGLINTNRARYLLGLDLELPETIDVQDFVGFDIDDPPALITDVRRLRKRFTTNALLQKRVKGPDFLFNTILLSFRGLIVDNFKGKKAIRSERPADFAHLRAATIVGAKAVLIEDVTSWKARMCSSSCCRVKIGCAPRRSYATTHRTGASSRKAGKLCSRIEGCSGRCFGACGGCGVDKCAKSVQAIPNQPAQQRGRNPCRPRKFKHPQTNATQMV